jgi:hypothetical protein
MNTDPNYIISARKRKRGFLFLCLTHKRCVLAIAIWEVVRNPNIFVIKVFMSPTRDYDFFMLDSFLQIGATLSLALCSYASISYPKLKPYLAQELFSDEGNMHS